MSSVPAISGLSTHTAPARAASIRGSYLFGPIVDFLCLGGGSLILISVVIALRPYVDRTELLAITFALAHIINHPHFAHSYQIFYRNFGKKIAGHELPQNLRLRYIFAGLGVPFLLLTFFVTAIANGNIRLLGWGASVMTLLVGWHYVKQGYGILMVVSVLQKQFFTANEKKVLLANAYSCWLTFWLAINWLVTERNFWGIKHYMLNVPSAIMVFSLCLSAVTSGLMLVMLARKWRASGDLPFNGVLAYLTTLYIWLFLLTDPIVALIIPACHSIQYLAVVWRYQLNYERHRTEQARDLMIRKKLYSSSTIFRFSIFVISGAILGYLGFWAAPEFIEGHVSYDPGIFGAALFLFSFWLFINVHHFFLDNVMWRRGNQDTSRYLFGH